MSSATPQTPRPPRSVSDVLALLGGADLEVLDHAQSERSSYTSLGLVMLATASVAALSMTFALQSTVFVEFDPRSGLPKADQPEWILPLSTTVGLLWGGLILVLDRALIKGMSGVHGRRAWAYAIPRLVLAFIIGVVVSTPLTLKVFEPEVLAQVKIDQEDMIRTARERADAGPTAVRLRQVEDQIAEQENILMGGSQLTDSPEVSAARQSLSVAKSELDKAKAKVEEKRLTMVCEASGAGSARPECADRASDEPGKGRLYDAAKAAYDAAVREEGSVSRKVDAAETALTQAIDNSLTQNATLVQADRKSARQQICGAEHEPRTIDTSPCEYVDPSQPTGLRAEAEMLKLDLESERDPSAIRSSGGLSAQLTALWNLGKAEPIGAGVPHLMIILLFLVIELLPMTIKTMSALRGESQYDRVRKKLSEEEFEQAAQRFDQSIADLDRDARKREAIAEDMVDRQVELGKMANEFVADEMVGVIRVVLDDWKQNLQHTMANHAQHGAAPAVATLPTQPTAAPAPFGLPPRATNGAPVAPQPSAASTSISLPPQGTP